VACDSQSRFRTKKTLPKHEESQEAVESADQWSLLWTRSHSKSFPNSCTFYSETELSESLMMKNNNTLSHYCTPAYASMRSSRYHQLSSTHFVTSRSFSCSGKERGGTSCRGFALVLFFRDVLLRFSASGSTVGIMTAVWKTPPATPTQAPRTTAVPTKT